MRIFFVCQRVPFPPDRGDKITTFNEIRHLSTKHEVHIFCLADGTQDLDNIPGLSRYAPSVTAVPVIGWKITARAQGDVRRRTAFGGGVQRSETAQRHQTKFRGAAARSDHGL